MRCPKCGESFQVVAPTASDPPVLGGALGLKAADAARPPPPKRKSTMMGMPSSPPAAPPKAAPPAPKRTMLGVAPGDADGFELASLDDDESLEADEDELDLSGSSGEDGFDLPVAVPVNHPPQRSPSFDEELDLPARVDADDPDEFDLPALNSLGDLPSPIEADLPELNAELPDLGAELPDLGGLLPSMGAALPQTMGDLPELIEDELDELDGPPSLHAPLIAESGKGIGPRSMASGGLDLSSPPPPPDSGGPTSSDDIFGHGPTFSPETLPPAETKSERGGAFGEVSIKPPLSEEGSAEFDAFPTESGPAPGGGPGVTQGYGNVSLDSEDADIDLGADIERGEAPSRVAPGSVAHTAAASAAVERPTGEDRKQVTSKRRRRTSGLSQGTRIVLAATVVLAIGGGALSLVPEIGPYGSYWLIDQMNGDTYRSQLVASVQRVNKKLSLDTADQVEKAFLELGQGRLAAPRFKPGVAYVAYVGFLNQLRFGAKTGAESQVLMKELAEVEPGTQYLDLARLAEKAATKQFDAVTTVGALNIPKSREHAVIVGEAALLKPDPTLALSAWEAVLKAQDDPRGHFGLARALRLAGKPEEAHQHVEATLKGNPAHAGARLLVAELSLKDREKHDEIEASLTPLSLGKGASPGEKVQALILLGQLHLKRSKIKQAEVAFAAALKEDSGNAAAQRGLAQALFDAGRFSEALARFEAALQSEPHHIDASLGLVRCKLRLEQLDDAVKQLDELLQKHPKSSAVAYWVGRGKESVGKKEEAQKAYEQAIEHGEDCPELVLSYVDLTRLLGQKGNQLEAQEVISQAVKRFPEDPTVFAALGELATSRGSYDEAIVNYEKALALDPKNIGLKFSRGVALRQARRFDEATKDFDVVEQESPDYPGLALERGNLFEAAGKTDEALKAYEGALAAAPQDLDLMLRVACGKAQVGQVESAIELIEPVLKARGNSAEANFCKGLALLNGEKDPSEAKRFLERAVAQDATRAKYHLYVGWVSIELQDFAKAAVSLDKTIELDRTLADAYWKRGELRVRQGAVVDALSDLDKSLELTPGRLEAHASRARALTQLGKEAEALEAWGKAVGAEVVDPAWQKDFGELLLANRRPAEARKQLEAAVAGASKMKPPPPWLPTAQRLLAMSIGRHKDAVPHWQAFLKAKEGTNNPYLREALTELTAILNQSGY